MEVLSAHGMRNELEASEREKERMKRCKERKIDSKGLLGKTSSWSNQVGTDICSSLGSIAEFKPIDLSKSSRQAVKRDRNRGRGGWTGIAREPLLP